MQSRGETSIARLVCTAGNVTCLTSAVFLCADRRGGKQAASRRGFESLVGSPVDHGWVNERTHVREPEHLGVAKSNLQHTFSAHSIFAPALPSYVA